MGFWADFWNIIAWFFWIYILFAYLMALFAVIGDIFRDHELNGWAKALWIIFLIFVPILAVLVYVIARGQGMAERNARGAARAQQDTNTYIREVAGNGSSSDEIAKAQALLTAGTINEAEFTALKAKALA